MGTIPHLAVVALAKSGGFEANHVPHKGDADSMMSLLGGHVSMFVSHTAVLASHAGKVRSLGLMADRRIAEFPDLPTLAEQGAPALNFDVWGGLVVPKGTPAPVIAALETACRQGTASAAFRRLLVNLQTPYHVMDSRTFTKFVVDEYAKNAALAGDAGVKKE